MDRSFAVLLPKIQANTSSLSSSSSSTTTNITTASTNNNTTATTARMKNKNKSIKSSSSIVINPMNNEFCGLAFKVIHDNNRGYMVFIRIYSG